MQQMEQIVLEDGIWYYSINKQEVILTGYEGKEETLMIPDKIGERMVTEIGKKALLGNRYLKHLVLPAAIERIGDWAFSGCSSLQRVEFPRKEISLGKQIFAKDTALKEIFVAGSDRELAKLLAAAVTMLEAEYLMKPEQAGNAKWYQSFDARMITILEEPEENALKNLVYCAEEDMCGKQDSCIRKQNQDKAKLALHRLTYHTALEQDKKEYLECFLQKRTKGCQDEAAWEVIKQNYDEQKAYCDTLFACGAISEENFEEALDDLRESQVELKAYLLRTWQEKNGATKGETNLWKNLEI